MEKWQELQARYYWKYVVNLDKTEDDLREKIQKNLSKAYKLWS